MQMSGSYQAMRKILKSMTDDQLYEFLVDLDDLATVQKIGRVQTKLIEDIMCCRPLKSESKEAKEIDDKQRYRDWRSEA
jgi:hypothetical protein